MGPATTARGEGIRDVRLEKGNVWVFKPRVQSKDGRLDFNWGADVVVTEKGGERLSKRPHGLISIV